MVQEEMSFKNIYYLELRRPFCFAEQIHVSNLSRGYMKNNSLKLF